MLYVDRRGGLCMVYADSDTMSTVHSVQGGDDVFGTLNMLSPTDFSLEQTSTTTRGVCRDSSIHWDDGDVWMPLTISALQHKQLTQKPYVPMTLLLAYWCYALVRTAVDAVRGWTKRFVRTGL